MHREKPKNSDYTFAIEYVAAPDLKLQEGGGGAKWKKVGAKEEGMMEQLGTGRDNRRNGGKGRG